MSFPTKLNWKRSYHSPKEPTGFINEPAEVFPYLSIPGVQKSGDEIAFLNLFEFLLGNFYLLHTPSRTVSGTVKSLQGEWHQGKI